MRAVSKPFPFLVRTPVPMSRQTSALAPTSSLLLSASAALDKGVGWVSKQCVSLSAILALVMAATIIIDLALRNFLGLVLDFIIEGETFLLIIVTFLSLAETQRNYRHVSVDILTSKLSTKTRLFLENIFSICGLYLFLIITWQLYKRGMQEYADGKATMVSEILFFPFTLLAAFGCLLMSLVLFQQMLANLGRLLSAYKRPLLFLILALATAAAFMVLPIIYQGLGLHLGKTALALLMLALMLLFMFLGFPVAFAMGFIGLLGTWCLVDVDIALGSVRLGAYDSVAEYFLSVIPFFILMGLFCLNAGISKALFKAAHTWLSRIPGGLAIATIFGCGGFAAICGDSMANAATMSSVALPEMKNYNYNSSLATGAVAAGGTLGILIPPSIGFIAYGIITEQSVGKLFMAGILPGILLMLLFSGIIYIRCKLNPSLGPTTKSSSWLEKILALRGTWQVMLLFILVMGGIYSGIVTPTEAGGVGVIGALILAALSAEFTWKKLFESLTLGIQMSAMIITLLIGVAILGNFITLTELPLNMSNWLQSLNLSRYVFFVCILILYLFLGMVMNIIPMIMVTLPIVYPSILALGFDPIWFGVVMVIMMEMGQISPPVGINVFVIHASAGNVSMATIFRGIVPFIFMQIIIIIILTMFPIIAMFLPKLMDVLPSIGG